MTSSFLFCNLSPRINVRVDMSLTQLDEYFKNLAQLNEDKAKVAKAGRPVKGSKAEWGNLTLRESLKDMLSSSTNFTEQRKDELLVEINALKSLV